MWYFLTDWNTYIGIALGAMSATIYWKVIFIPKK